MGPGTDANFIQLRVQGPWDLVNAPAVVGDNFIPRYINVVTGLLITFLLLVEPCNPWKPLIVLGWNDRGLDKMREDMLNGANRIAFPKVAIHITITAR